MRILKIILYKTKTHRLRIVETLEEKFCLKLTNEILMVYVASTKEDLYK